MQLCAYVRVLLLYGYDQERSLYRGSAFTGIHDSQNRQLGDVVDNLVDNVYSCMMDSKGIRLESLESELKEKETKINNIQRNVERVANVPVTLLERLSELEKERDLLLAEMDAERLRVRLSKEDIKSFILNFNTEYDDALIRTFVTKVILYDDHAIVEYDAGDDNKAINVTYD